MWSLNSFQKGIKCSLFFIFFLFDTHLILAQILKYDGDSKLVETNKGKYMEK